MAAKELLFRDEARARMLHSVELLAEAVKFTLGPRGRTVVLDRDFGAPQIVNSGVLRIVARALEEPLRRMIANAPVAKAPGAAGLPPMGAEPEF
ncbi:hypothetical protein HZU83_08280 [Sphaerotilus montanus]|uniref:Chaperonin GroEL (HSP60 family) n=1 Tax=Sphaerotilus montanus TaxID=522889 RepID=A0A7Y9R2Q8_9BURK|nr:hypothetical protein [Sphaerotilus montanus]NYG34584.1 chaperonin GroEL (HSP60 family) [Sphaerotilus montanus]NZD56678.1 hypothetical protein [Sphaerotilus montanus]